MRKSPLGHCGGSHPRATHTDREVQLTSELSQRGLGAGRRVTPTQRPTSTSVSRGGPPDLPNLGVTAGRRCDALRTHPERDGATRVISGIRRGLNPLEHTSRRDLGYLRQGASIAIYRCEGDWVALVFVSHSGRDGPPDTNVGEQQRRESMRAARDALVSALRGNHRVWLDRERLGPGVDWEDSILSGLTACEVGVVLLDHETVAEPGYVLKEATILAYRRYLDRAFRFVPSLWTTRSMPRSRTAGRGEPYK